MKKNAQINKTNAKTIFDLLQMSKYLLKVSKKDTRTLFKDVAVVYFYWNRRSFLLIVIASTNESIAYGNILCLFISMKYFIYQIWESDTEDL